MLGLAGLYPQGIVLLCLHSASWVLLSLCVYALFSFLIANSKFSSGHYPRSHIYVGLGTMHSGMPSVCRSVPCGVVTPSKVRLFEPVGSKSL
jgi:hypothetical protein